MYRFAHIEYLNLLWLIPLVIIGFVLYRAWQKRAQRTWGDVHLTQQMTLEVSPTKPWVHLIYFCGILFFAAIALANPQVGTKTETVERQGIDLVFALDLSASMLAEDITPSRLEKAKYLISKTIDQLGGDRVGIIAYAGNAYPLLPITTDYSAAKLALQSASPDFIPTPGTALDKALSYSLTYFDPQSPASKVLVILSDGEDHDNSWADQVEALKSRGIIVISIGLGTAKGGPIPQKVGNQVVGYKKDANGQVVITRLVPDVLEDLARQTNGKYVLGSNTNATINTITEALSGLNKVAFEEQTFTDYEDQFQWFLGVAIILLLLHIGIGTRKSTWLQKLGLKS